MRDRGYERRAEMVGWLIALGGAVVVIVHFVCKFW